MSFQGPFEGVSNRADWFAGVKMTDATDGSLIDLTGAIGTMKLRGGRCHTKIIAQTDDGTLTFPEPGFVVWNIDADTMSSIEAATYQCGILVERDGVMLQLLLLNVSILEGL